MEERLRTLWTYLIIINTIDPLLHFVSFTRSCSNFKSIAMVKMELYHNGNMTLNVGDTKEDTKKD